MKNPKPYIKYLYLFLVDIGYFVTLMLSILMFKDVNFTWLFSYADLVMLYSIPIYILLRAILSRIFLKNVWLPNLILFLEIWPGVQFLSGEFDFGGIIIAIIIYFLSSTLSLFTGAIMRLISHKKNNK